MAGSSIDEEASVQAGGPRHIARWSHCGPLALATIRPPAGVPAKLPAVIVERYEIIDAPQTPPAPT